MRKAIVALTSLVLLSLAVNVAAAGLSDTTDDGTGTIGARGENLPNEGAAKVFDNNTATKWLDFSPASSWIQYQYAFDKKSVVTEYTLTSANDSNQRDPMNWNILGSNDGGASWVTLDTRTNELFTARFQKRSFLFTNSTAYNIYRLSITQLRGGSPAPTAVQLAEIEFIGTPPVPPVKATSPNPANIATGVPITATLSWTAGWGAASHDVYFGTVFSDVNNASRLLADLNGNGIVDWNDVSRLTEYWLLDPAGTEPYAAVDIDGVVDFIDYALLAQDWMNTAGPVFNGNQDANSFSPGTLALNTTYCWRIDEVNGPNTVTGDVWSFTTQSGKAYNPIPANSVSNVAINATLSWSASASATSHNVYFGTANSPPSIGNQTTTTYNPGTLANSTTYYWRIDEVGGSGTITGDLWSFTTVAGGPEFTFVQASDPQMGWTQCGNQDALWGTTISKINIINPAFVIVTGDLINSNSNNTQAALYKSYAAGINPGIPIYTLPGNHDISEPSSSTKYAWWLSNLAYPTGLANPWYSFTYGNDIFICLDSGVFRTDWGGKQAAEIAWLTQTLQDANAAGYTHKFVFMHVSLCITSVDEPYNSADNLPLAIRGQLLDLFHQYGVKAVFAGHRHTNNYVLDGDLEIITTSSCTCGLGSPPTTPGVRIINVYSDHIEQTYRNLTDIQ